MITSPPRNEYISDIKNSLKLDGLAMAWCGRTTYSEEEHMQI
jgi:hypothetical protein